MPPKHSNIRFAALTVSVAFVALVLGIMLDDKVIPEANKPLMTEETVSPSELQVLHTDQINELDERTKTTIENAENLTKRGDQLISQSGLSKVESDKQISLKNNRTAKRLAELRSRLGDVKQ